MSHQAHDQNFSEALTLAQKAYHNALGETGNEALSLKTAQDSMRESGAEHNLAPQDVEQVVNSDGFLHDMQGVTLGNWKTGSASSATGHWRSGCRRSDIAVLREPGPES